MNKIPRFVKEYANYQKKTAKTLPNEKHATEIISEIDRVIKVLDRNLITTNEAMKMILNAFELEEK